MIGMTSKAVFLVLKSRGVVFWRRCFALFVATWSIIRLYTILFGIFSVKAWPMVSRLLAANV